MGQHVRFRATPTPIDPGPRRVVDLPVLSGGLAPLANYTYVVATTQDAVIWVTSATPHPATAAVIDGIVIARQPHPDHSGRWLVVVRADAWTTPILFR